jgi:hypothetical protein
VRGRNPFAARYCTGIGWQKFVARAFARDAADRAAARRARIAAARRVTKDGVTIH